MQDVPRWTNDFVTEGSSSVRVAQSDCGYSQAKPAVQTQAPREHGRTAIQRGAEAPARPPLVPSRMLLPLRSLASRHSRGQVIQDCLTQVHAGGPLLMISAKRIDYHFNLIAVLALQY